jgi:uncharacterized protein (TIGR03084 family)
MSGVDEVRHDLAAEQSALDSIVAGIAADDWGRATPSPGWTVADQIGHLTYFDGTAALAITDPPAFAASASGLYAAAIDETVGVDEHTLGGFRRLGAPGRLAAWRENRRLLDDAAATLSDDRRVDWYGPSMGARSFLTARLMEVWAHGTDVADAVGAVLEPTDRLRHIAQLGYITRRWSYTVRGEPAPEGDVRVVLAAPSGGQWTFGPDDAADTVSGPAEDFCLVVTQRRHIDDTALVSGGLARHWLLRAQAFAGGPTDPPGPRRT